MSSGPRRGVVKDSPWTVQPGLRARGAARTYRVFGVNAAGTPIALGIAMADESARLCRELFVKHHRWIRVVARRRFGIGMADVDEVVQKVFIIAYRALQTQAVESERAWLSAITRRVCANERRNLRLRREVEAQYRSAVACAGPDSRLLARDILSALGKLDSRQRELVDLTCFEGMSLYGAAGRLGVSVRVVESRLQVAKTTLRRQLDGVGSVNSARLESRTRGQ